MLWGCPIPIDLISCLRGAGGRGCCLPALVALPKENQGEPSGHLVCGQPRSWRPGVACFACDWHLLGLVGGACGPAGPTDMCVRAFLFFFPFPPCVIYPWNVGGVNHAAPWSDCELHIFSWRFTPQCRSPLYLFQVRLCLFSSPCIRPFGQRVALPSR